MGDAQMPLTTIPPFQDIQSLPPCAVGCDALYAANAPCVPPEAAQAEASVYTACFCSQGVLAPLSSTTVGVCDTVCDDTGMGSIATWFRDICSIDSSNNNGNSGNGGNGNNNGNGNGGNNDDDSESSTSTTGGSQSTSLGNSSGGGGGDWLSNHWKWVVMIVILVVAIAGIWIGACIWRRRYLKKKDRQTSLGQKHSGSASRPSWGPPVTGSGNVAAPGAVYSADGASDRGSKRGSRGMFSAQPTSSVFEDEKPKEKKKWTVRERT